MAATAGAGADAADLTMLDSRNVLAEHNTKNSAETTLLPTEPSDESSACPSGEPGLGAGQATATFPAAGSIQPPPRLQRSSIPPPIDTENATRDADSSLREKLLSTLSPALPSAEQQQQQQEQPAKAAAPPGMEESTAATTELSGDAAGEPAGPDISAACPHIGVAFATNRRYRRTMEDAHYHQYDFEGVEGQVLMAVFDGHAGRQAAQWCGDNFADVFLQLKQKHPNLPIPDIFNMSFIEADRRLAVDLKTHSGCTAAVAFVQVTEAVAGDPATRQRTLYCANAGDARAVLSRAGTAVRLTYDHKGDDARECARISESGILSVTRALGDSSLKQFVIGNPYTTETILDGADDVLILACDGLWDVCSDQEAVDLVRSIDSHPAHASQMLLEHALSNESMDNITTMVFRLPMLP
ncbi:phosphatase 2C [Coemansia sp. RSA 2424]|nr:phosphatase 2C [Coemansia sp. RSA 2424]